MTAIEDNAMKKRLEASGINPDTVDTKALKDSSVSYSENVHAVEEATGRTLKTQEEQRRDIRQSEIKRQEEHVRELEEGSRAMDKYALQEAKSKEAAKIREEGYKQEGDVLQKHFALSPEQTKKKESKAVTFLKGVSKNIDIAKGKTIEYARERAPLTPLSGEADIAARERYLKRTAGVRALERQSALQKHEMKTYKLAEQKQNIAIQQSQKALQKPYYKPSQPTQESSRGYPGRSGLRGGQLPFLGDVAVIRREGGAGGLVNPSARPNTGLLTRSTRTGPDWRGRGGLDWRSPPKKK